MLRDVVEQDLEIFFEQQREPEACAMASFPPRERDAFLMHWISNVFGSDDVKKQTIAQGGAVAGNIVSWTQGGRRLVGYWLGKAFWGRGLATEALVDFVARVERTRPLHAYVARTNAASIRVLEKCGFIEESNDEVERLMVLSPR